MKKEMEDMKMADKKLSKAVVVSNEMLAEGIYSMWIQEADIAVAAKPGQFISLYSKDGSRLLPRPISICEIEKEKGMLRLVFRVAGAGTKEFAAANAGEEIPVLGPLGGSYFNWWRYRYSSYACISKETFLQENDCTWIS